MVIDILSLFSAMFDGPFADSIINRACEEQKVTINIHDLRKWGLGTRRQVDDRPYGGGKGMILMVEPISQAIRDLSSKNTHKILTTPQGNVFTQSRARKLSKKKHILIITGRYEGFDERIRDLVDEEISIGDYILLGGELPAMVITETIVRLLPGVLDNEATEQESFSTNVLEYPQYTRPEEFNKKQVPEILLSGNQAEIEKWRQEESKKLTKLRRPDLSRN